VSVRQGILALLSQRPMYGAQLRSEFEDRTGGTWPLNIGQVYTTIARLQRDGLVEDDVEPDDEGRKEYTLTDAGRDEVAAWWSSAAPPSSDPRDELTIKLALGVTMPGVDVADVVQRQRAAGMQRLQELTAEKRRGPRDLAAELVLERRIFDAEALVRWLDHVEGRLSESITSTSGTSTKETS
jgi:DNA-binding PadR family transcriptional regulator